MGGEENGNHAEHHEKVGHLQAEVHTLTKAVEKLFNKFDEFVDRSAPKQLTPSTIVGLVVGILTIFALLFGSVIYIANSANAPLVAQMNQHTVTLQAVHNMVMQNSNTIQLVNKDGTATNNKAEGNEETLRWLIYEEQLPRQITELNGRIDNLQLQLELKGK